jgi:hypothetical protein
MPIHCPFEPLSATPFSLQDYGLEEALGDWLVAFSSHADDGLFYRTAVEALVLALDEAYGEDAARLVSGWCGEAIALVRPEDTDAHTLAAWYAAGMLNGQHPNPLYYRKVLGERCAEIWLEMATPDRVVMLQTYRGSIVDALADAVPDIVRARLEEMFE